MKCYANLYRDSEGRGFFDRTFLTSHSAEEHKAEQSRTLEYVATVAIVVVSGSAEIPHAVIQSALLNAAIPPSTLRPNQLDEDFHAKFVRLEQGPIPSTKTSESYKEHYTIHAVPYQLAAGGEWVPRVTILSDRGADTRLDQYTDNDACSPTYDEAMARCFEFGRKIIDEELAGK